MTDQLEYHYGHKTLLELLQLQENGHLNLEPGFQRKSVWTLNDRRKLIQSIFDGYPIPSIFLYLRMERGRPVYDVLDGKQRLESLFMFAKARGFRRQGFDVRYQFDDDERAYWHDWKAIEEWELNGLFLNYRIQTVEVEGDLSDIIDLFIRINSTGKALTSSEKRHARYTNSPLLREATKLARRHREYLQKGRVVSSGQIARMKDIELVAELLVSIIKEGPIDRKIAVDRAVGNEAINQRILKKAISEFTRTLNALKRLLPDIASTRFHNSSEFYTLFMVLWGFNKQQMILTDSKRNADAKRLLTQFSDGVDRVRELQRKARGAKASERLYASYLMSVQQSTDKLTQRNQRAGIVTSLLSGIFEKKDLRRTFSPEQRRLLWNSDQQKQCSNCKVRLDWTNFHADHVKAHSGGGKTSLGNAAILCVSCNTRKGGRPQRRRRRA